MSLYFYLLFMCLSILGFEVFSGFALSVENSSPYKIDLLHAPLIYYGFIVGAVYSVYAFVYTFRKIELKVLDLTKKEDVGGVR